MRASEFKKQLETIRDSIDNSTIDLEKYITKMNRYIDEYDAVEMALTELEQWYSSYVQFLVKCDKEAISDDDYDKLKVCLLIRILIRHCVLSY